MQIKIINVITNLRSLFTLQVVHPDQLLSGTSIVSSLFCTRKAVLAERFKGLEGETCLASYSTLAVCTIEKIKDKNIANFYNTRFTISST